MLTQELFFRGIMPDPNTYRQWIDHFEHRYGYMSELFITVVRKYFRVNSYNLVMTTKLMTEVTTWQG